MPEAVVLCLAGRRLLWATWSIMAFRTRFSCWWTGDRTSTDEFRQAGKRGHEEAPEDEGARLRAAVGAWTLDYLLLAGTSSTADRLHRIQCAPRAYDEEDQPVAPKVLRALGQLSRLPAFECH